MNNNNLYSKKKIIIAVLIAFVVLVAIISLPNNEKVDLTVVNGSPDGGSEQTVLVADGLGPYTVTYLGTTEGTYSFSVTTSSPVGREKALDWFRSQGYNPSEINIDFADYHNPLKQGQGDE